MSSLLIVNGHADPDSLTHTLCAAYEQRARSQVAVERLDLADLSFDPVLRKGHRSPQPLEPDLEKARAAIVQARHVAWFFPLWWAAAPALVKGFIDRVLTPGFAFRYGSGPLQEKLLRGRSARFVTSMDAPRFWYLLVQRRALHSSFVASTLDFVGFGPVRTSTFYSARTMDARARERACRAMERAADQDVQALLGPGDSRGLLLSASHAR